MKPGIQMQFGDWQNNEWNWEADIFPACGADKSNSQTWHYN